MPTASRLPGRRLHQRSRHRHRPALRRCLHRLPVLCLELPLLRPPVQCGARCRRQMRHVPRPPYRRPRTRLRQRLPRGRHRDRDRRQLEWRSDYAAGRSSRNARRRTHHLHHAHHPAPKMPSPTSSASTSSRIHPEHAHSSLVFMTTLMQARHRHARCRSALPCTPTPCCSPSCFITALRSTSLSFISAVPPTRGARSRCGGAPGSSREVLLFGLFFGHLPPSPLPVARGRARICTFAAMQLLPHSSYSDIAGLVSRASSPAPSSIWSRPPRLEHAAHAHRLPAQRCFIGALRCRCSSALRHLHALASAISYRVPADFPLWPGTSPPPVDRSTTPSVSSASIAPLS